LSTIEWFILEPEILRAVRCAKQLAEVITQFAEKKNYAR
jgi:hypothetical protein